MPTTPFIGLSIVVHISIIAFHKLFDKKPSKRQKKPTRARYVFGCLIVVVMFSGVTTMAGTLVYASLEDPHSTVHLAEASGPALVAFVDSHTKQAFAATHEADDMQPSTHTGHNSNTDDLFSYIAEELAFGVVVLIALFVLFLPYLLKPSKNSPSAR